VYSFHPVEPLIIPQMISMATSKTGIKYKLPSAEEELTVTYPMDDT